MHSVEKIRPSKQSDFSKSTHSYVGTMTVRWQFVLVK